MATSPFLKLEKRIATDERDGILYRWRYGRQLLDSRAGRKQLPHGMIGDLIAAAARAGLKLSEREIQRRMRLSTVYDSEAKVRQALTDFGSWSEIVNAGFPAVDVDGDDVDPDDLEMIGEPDPLAQDPLFDIPGFKPVLKINGRKVQLTEATVREAVEYRDMVREMHESFGRTVAQIDATVEAMLDGCDGDLDANAVEAWQRGTGEDAEDEPTEAGAA